MFQARIVDGLRIDRVKYARVKYAATFSARSVSKVRFDVMDLDLRYRSIRGDVANHHTDAWANRFNCEFERLSTRGRVTVQFTRDKFAQIRLSHRDTDASHLNGDLDADDQMFIALEAMLQAVTQPGRRPRRPTVVTESRCGQDHLE